MRSLLLLLLSIAPILSFSQITSVRDSLTPAKRLTVELLASEFSHSRRFFNFNENDRTYTEVRVGLKLNKYFEVAVVAGYMRKDYLYFAQKNGSTSLLFMERRYMPVGVNGRLQISELLNEKVGLWKKPGRWDAYIQVGVNTLLGKDIPDERENAFRNQGYFVPYYLYPYVVRYNRLYVTYVLGARFNFSKTFGAFIEGGEGSLNNLHLGLRCSF